MDDEKQIRWVGSAYDDLLAFPKDARKEAGFQLWKLQAGREPTDWKPFGRCWRRDERNSNPGRERDLPSNYLAKFEEAIYVLHCFRKKTQATSKQDKAIAAARYRAVITSRKER